MIRIFLNVLLFISLSFSQAENSNPDISHKVWIYFKDKGPQENPRLYKAASLVSERSLKRRAKVLLGSALTDYYDLPVYQSYIDVIKPYVQRVRTKSRWLNAISVEIDPGLIAQIELLDFVHSVQKVRSSRRRFPEPEQIGLRKMSIDSSDYGPSYNQLAQIKVPELHEKGIYGQGVLICMLDAGYNLIYSHEAFDSLDIVATWDFADNNADVTGHSHGTYTLSALAGYAPGHLIGPAFKASFLLARTEVASSETPAEEDYWVAGIEWADSNGADIVSSSLGYSEFDNPLNDYTYEDLDGKTATTTIAAEIAADKGIIVFNSAGNEYNYPWHYIITPADGERVMAVAAVTGLGQRASFSSVGPTPDGRIKPDLAALGAGVVSASSIDSTNYIGVSGTSLSCPLVSGTGALLLSAFPAATPDQIRQALKQTASQNAYPDTLLGWGIIDASAAYNYLNEILNISENKDNLPIALELKQNYPNPFNPSTTLRYRFKTDVNVSIEVYNLLGERVAIFHQDLQEGGVDQQFQISFPQSSASGIYYYRVSGKDVYTRKVYSKSGKMVLLR